MKLVSKKHNIFSAVCYANEPEEIITYTKVLKESKIDFGFISKLEKKDMLSQLANWRGEAKKYRADLIISPPIAKKYNIKEEFLIALFLTFEQAEDFLIGYYEKNLTILNENGYR